MADFTLTSSAFEDGALLEKKYGCDGDKLSPPLAWSGAPEGTVSFALIANDPDVPKEKMPSGNIDHWILFNIPAETTEIEEGNGAGTAGSNTFGKTEYIPPCPPKDFDPSEHRYFFWLYALDTKLELSEGATREEVEAAMEGHVLAQAQLMGRYEQA